MGIVARSARSTLATKRAIRPKRAKPASWRSWRGVKKEPDCRKSAPNRRGCSRRACSMASAPRLAPMPARALAGASRGSSAASARVWRAEAE